MPTVCFQLRVQPDRLDADRERHATVWPERLEATSVGCIPDAGSPPTAAQTRSRRRSQTSSTSRRK